MSNPAWFRHEWIWHKNKATGHLNAKRAPMKAHESVLVFASKTAAFNTQMTTGHKATSAYYNSHNGSNYGDGKRMCGGGSTLRYPRSVQDFPIINNDDSNKIHPTQKPVALFEYLIKTYTNEGEIVLDNTAGSGTTAIACINTNRRWVCIEKDETYASKAVERIKNYQIETEKEVLLDKPELLEVEV
jgi:site-specific DNA-methyltransferase (adenine-specific)